MKFLRRNKGDKKSLLKPKRFFGKKADRSDSVDGRSRFSSQKEEEISPTFEDVPEISLEPVDDSNLNVTILTQESTPPVTPVKYGEEGSISDTISDLSASIVPCLTSVPTAKPPSPAEKMILTIANQQGSASSRLFSPNGESASFTDHRGAGQNTGGTKETNNTASTRFSISDMIDQACTMPWSSNVAPDDNTIGRDSQGPSWGMAPSVDDDDQIGGGPSLDYTAPSMGDTLPEGDTLPSAAGDTLPTETDLNTTNTEERPVAYVSDDDEEEEDYEEEDAGDDADDDASEEQEGYELVLDSNTEKYHPKKSMGAVWKRMKIAKSRAATPPVNDEDKDEKYRAVFGADPDGSLNKRTNSFFARLSNNRSKTPESKATDESRNEKDAYEAAAQKKPHMINLSEELLNPEDLVDKKGEREEHELNKSSGAGPDKKLVDESEPAKASVEEKETITPEEPTKETIDSSVPRSRSWNMASAVKRSISADQAKRSSSDGGAREDVGSPTMGLLNLLSGTPKKTEKPKPEEPRSPKPVWKAAVDPHTGSTYYYHRLTRQTTWTKPPDFDDQNLQKDTVGAGSLSAEQQRKVEEGLDVRQTAGKVTSILRSSSNDGSQRPYTKKQEHIKELLLDMSPPDPASVDKIIDEYRGREDELIDQLNEIVESQPFDEPINKSDHRHDSEGEGGMRKTGSFRLPLSTKSRSLKNRVMTASSIVTGRSNLTGRSNFSGNSRQTLKTGNTTTAARNSVRLYPVVSDISRSSIDQTPSRPSGGSQGKPPLPSKKPEVQESPVQVVKAPSPHEPEMARVARAAPRQKQVAEEPSPVKVIKAPRNRELLVEEYSSKSRYGLRAEKYSGKALSGRRRPFREAKKPSTPRQETVEKETTDDDTSEMEHDSIATDSVSGLSASDAGFNTRKDEFDAAARSALDDAIRNGDWELAATVTDEMRGEHNHAATSKDDVTNQEWTQSSLDKFISDNDWDAVARYIASMRDRNSQADPEVAHPPSNYSGGPARKRFGARSQLQHDLEHQELEQSSSWDSGTSFGSEFYSTASSADSPLESPRRVPSDPRKNFAC